MKLVSRAPVCSSHTQQAHSLFSSSVHFAPSGVPSLLLKNQGCVLLLHSESWLRHRRRKKWGFNLVTARPSLQNPKLLANKSISTIYKVDLPPYGPSQASLSPPSPSFYLVALCTAPSAGQPLLIHSRPSKTIIRSNSYQLQERQRSGPYGDTRVRPEPNSHQRPRKEAWGLLPNP